MACTSYLWLGDGRMISIKDYAKARGVSYEAVRQQVVRYASRDVEGFRLADHITKVDRTQYLDDEGAAFLDMRRAKNPVIIQQEERGETVERLRARIDELQTRLITAQDEYKALLGEKHAIEMREQALLADKQMIDSIRADAAQAAARAEEAEAARKQADEEAADARAQAEQREKEAREAREEVVRLRAEAAEAEKSAEDARSRAERMESAGLIARIFRNW